LRAIVNRAVQCLLALAPAGMLLAENAPVIKVGGDDSYPPYEFIDKDGNIAGYNVDMTRAIAEVMGIEVDITLASWSEMRAALEHLRAARELAPDRAEHEDARWFSLDNLPKLSPRMSISRWLIDDFFASK